MIHAREINGPVDPSAVVAALGRPRMSCFKLLRVLRGLTCSSTAPENTRHKSVFSSREKKSTLFVSDFSNHRHLMILHRNLPHKKQYKAKKLGNCYDQKDSFAV